MSKSEKKLSEPQVVTITRKMLVNSEVDSVPPEILEEYPALAAGVEVWGDISDKAKAFDLATIPASFERNGKVGIFSPNDWFLHDRLQWQLYDAQEFWAFHDRDIVKTDSVAAPPGYEVNGWGVFPSLLEPKDHKLSFRLHDKTFLELRKTDWMLILIALKNRHYDDSSPDLVRLIQGVTKLVEVHDQVVKL